MRGHTELIALRRRGGVPEAVHNGSVAPNWDRVRRYYRQHCQSILAAGANSWGLDPYQWEFEAEIELTPIERLFWFDVRAEGVVLYPQYPVDRFFVDFGNPAVRVAVECDGAFWHVDAARDAERQAELEAAGWSVYRITGSDCWRDDIEDEDRRRVIEVSPGRQLLRQICVEHDIGLRPNPRSLGFMDSLSALLTMR